MLAPVVSPPTVGRSRSQATSRRVTPTPPSTTPTAAAAEKLLPNGDLYSGTFSRNTPHGSGKYLWSDGCMYEGEFRRGKASGKGKFSWPSGATFEGEFKAGRMEGFGTFTGSEGDTYRGSWSADRKHGYGEKRYVNGDFYDGRWRGDLQDGHGRYVWKNGNEYVGEWRNGVINGRGVLIWANGYRYDGVWENSVFRSPEESVIDDFPGRICIWESEEGESGDITCDILDNVEGYRQFHRSSSCFNRRGDCEVMMMKKPGETIFKGHKNYHLMLNLQLGIRYSVGKHAPTILRELKPSDFDPKEKFWTRFPAGGSKVTPPHSSWEFRWKDYCPVVFRHLRELFKVDAADYMVAICGSDSLRKLSSPGKSGSFFYLTQDDRFIIKTVKKSEVKVLIKMLPNYHKHVSQYGNSLLTKFFGVHCVKPVGGLKTRFIVMGNLFCSEYPIHRRFDLKGSFYGRTTYKPDAEIDETTTLKDLDLDYVFRLKQNWFQQLTKQVERDCAFLEAERIMDYSLLVGLHFRDKNIGDKMGLSPFLMRTGTYDTSQNAKFMRGCRFFEAELQDMDRILAGRKSSTRLGANMPVSAERVARRSDVGQYIPKGGGGFSSSIRGGGETYDAVVSFGIIDILQDYDITKKLERAYKSLQADPTSISAVDPKLYSKRFRDFIARTFVEEEDNKK